jgi:YbgC/YbaW family acyl-CoA thioester hydrolase
MTPPVSRHRLRRRVHFHELDPAGIVHFSWFFRYMEEAEHAMWREAGLSIAPPGRDIEFPRVSTAFEFHHPLRFEEEFDIAIRIDAVTAKSIGYVCEITRGDVRIATGRMTVVCVTASSDGTLRATPIPERITSRLAAAAGDQAR